MSRQLDDLSPAMRQKAYELIARCAEEGMPVFIVDTLRTAAEHAENLKKGVSWTIHSKHLDGDAIDICPYHTYALHGPDKLQWDPEDPTWNRIGKIGESLGLRWGGRWKRKDLGHFELVRA
jgi:peptidoglycan L-alanyl-D-glutamate endopeptidase CwlK